MFGVIGIAAFSRRDILAVLVFLVAIGCALSANFERRRGHA
jgi:Na+/H+-dicarboxylate symporter